MAGTREAESVLSQVALRLHFRIDECRAVANDKSKIWRHGNRITIDPGMKATPIVFAPVLQRRQQPGIGSIKDVDVRRATTIFVAEASVVADRLVADVASRCPRRR